MTKERIPISGDLKSKVKQLMEYAGWYEGRSVDISIAEQYYANHGVPMMKTTQRFYRKYFGLCCEWYLEQKKLNWAADFEFALFPYLVNGIKNHLEEAYFRDMSGCELAEIEQAAGQKCQPIGHIGYYLSLIHIFYIDEPGLTSEIKESKFHEALQEAYVALQKL